MQNGAAICKNIWQFFKNLEIQKQPYNPTFALLGIYPRNIKIHVHTRTYTWMFVVPVFVMAPNCNNTHPLTCEWLNDQVAPYHGILFCNKKKQTVYTHIQQLGWISRKLWRMKKSIYVTNYMIPFIEHSWSDKIIEMEKRSVLVKGWGGRSRCD